MCCAKDLQKLFSRFLPKISQPDHFQAATQRTCAACHPGFLVSFLQWAAAFVANPLGRLPSPRGGDNCSGDHPSRMCTWRHSSKALNRLLRGSFGFVPMRFQDNTGLYGTAVALKNKPAPDNPSPARIFSEPTMMIPLWVS